MRLSKLIRSYTWLLLLAAFLIFFPMLFPSLAFVNIVSEMLIMAIFAVSLNLLIGYTGLVSFGHSAFFAIGSYTTGILLQKFSATLPSPLLVSLLSSMILAGIVALVIGYFCTRLTAIYFSFLTLAFSQIIYTVIVKWDKLTGGDQGLVGGIPKPMIHLFGLALPVSSPFQLYFFITVLALGSFLILKILTDSPFGWTLRSIRENPERMNFLGINVRKYQTIVFTISGFFTGLAGALMALHVSGSYPDYAHWTKSAEPIFMIMVGGLRVFTGPILGAALITQLSAYVSKYTGAWGLIFGGFLILYLMISREGILDVLAVKWSGLKKLRGGK